MNLNLKSLTNFNDNRANSGLETGLFVRRPSKGETKYYLFMPGTTTPFLSGDYDTIEYSILQNGYKSKIFEKMTIDDKEVEFALHRDNAIRIQEFVGEQLDFLSVTQDGIGYEATGSIKYKPNDAEEGSVHTGSYTIVASSVSTEAIPDVRPLIQDTVIFKGAVPESIDVSSADGVTVPIESLVDGYTIAVEIKDNDGKVVTTFTATPTQPLPTEKKGSVKFTKGTSATSDNYACAYITISKEGSASWTTTILLESHDTTATQPASYSASYTNKQ